ncbi:MAG: HNH endonuclease domain-containing protein [Gammaproteobacteria bacterium]
MSINKKAVWEKAKEIEGKNSQKVRQDPYGNEIHYKQYGKNTQHGWEVDHIEPKALGGSDNTRNLQAMQTKKNRDLGDSLKKRSRHNQK